MMNPQATREDFPVNSQNRLSQGQLNMLQTCPRKFQYTYLEHLSSPVTPDQREKMAWGSRFHLLMQQRELGLPEFALLQADEQMQRCYTGLLEAAPDLFEPESLGKQQFRAAEHRRIMNFQGYLFTVIYDLMIADDTRARILDWKTYPLPKKDRTLEENWQTRLYPFVLAETSDYAPENITMTYWFVQSAETGNDRLSKCESWTLQYNRLRHQETAQHLTQLLNQLNRWTADYENRKPFPQVAVTEGICYACPFLTRCQRGGDSGFRVYEGDRTPAFSDIEEVAL
jgi:hypothetical protein